MLCRRQTAIVIALATVSLANSAYGTPTTEDARRAAARQGLREFSLGDFETDYEVNDGRLRHDLFDLILRDEAKCRDVQSQRLERGRGATFRSDELVAKDGLNTRVLALSSPHTFIVASDVLFDLLWLVLDKNGAALDGFYCPQTGDLTRTGYLAPKSVGTKWKEGVRLIFTNGSGKEFIVQTTVESKPAPKPKKRKI